MSVFITADTFANAYSRLLDTCMRRPDVVCSPRGMEVKELISPAIRVTNPTSRFYASEARSTPMRYAAGEFLWYFGLRNDPEFIMKYSAFWNQIRNTSSTHWIDHGKVNSSYGMLAMGDGWRDATWDGREVTQWQWALNSIARDPNTRQAVVHIARPQHQLEWVKDFPCTMSFQFFLRDVKVHMVANMRSNDLIKGLTFDFPMFSFFLEQFIFDLEHQTGTEYDIGTLTVVSGSSHIYSRDYETVSSMLSGGISPMLPASRLNEPPLINSRDGTRDWSQSFKTLMRKANGDDAGEFAHHLDSTYTAFWEAL